MIKQLILAGVLIVQSTEITKEKYYRIASSGRITEGLISSVVGFSPTKRERNWVYWCDRNACIKGYFVGESSVANAIKWESR